MSAPNFKSLSDTIYALDVSTEYDVNDAKASILDDLRAIADKRQRNKFYVNDVDEIFDNDRNYGGISFIVMGMRNERDDVAVVTTVILRDGYYSGVNFDFDSRVLEGYGGEYISFDELTPEYVRDLITDYNGDEKRPTVKQAEAIYNRLLRDRKTLEGVIKKVLTKYTTPLQHVATFNNGEAVYERAKHSR